MTAYANKNDLNLILPGVAVLNVVDIGKTDKYEIFTDEPRKLFIEAYTCGGFILVSGSNSFWNLNQDNYDMTLTHEANSHMVGTVVV